jgi:predicted aspartyl protease
MGTVYANITLKNAGDVSAFERRNLQTGKVRQTTVRALVDTGSGTLVINENIRKKLGLSIRGLRRTTLANGEHAVCQITEPVEIHWNDRTTVCHALVAPDAVDVCEANSKATTVAHVLLGVIPLEDMDLIVNPTGQELIGAHGDEVIAMAK